MLGGLTTGGSGVADSDEDVREVWSWQSRPHPYVLLGVIVAGVCAVVLGLAAVLTADGPVGDESDPRIGWGVLAVLGVTAAAIGVTRYIGRESLVLWDDGTLASWRGTGRERFVDVNGSDIVLMLRVERSSMTPAGDDVTHSFLYVLPARDVDAPAEDGMKLWTFPARRDPELRTALERFATVRDRV